MAEHPTLWQVSAELDAALAQVGDRDDLPAARTLRTAGAQAFATVMHTALLEDLWSMLARDVGHLTGADLEPLGRIWNSDTFVHGLEISPPLSSDELTTKGLGALARLLAAPPSRDALWQTAAEARADLLELGDVLVGLLVGPPKIPESLWAQSLRAPLTEARDLTRAAGPLGLVTAVAAEAGSESPVATALGAAVADVVGSEMKAARGGRRRRSVQGWRNRAKTAMGDLDALLEPVAEAGIDVDEVKTQTTVATGVLVGLSVARYRDPATETRGLLHEVRRTVTPSGVPDALREAVRNWATLSPGWVKEYRAAHQRAEEQPLDA